MRISIESSELIKEAKADIREFGGEKEVAVWYIMVNGVPAITNYDFIDEETPIKFSELLEGEANTKIKLQKVLDVLIKQNRCLKGEKK